MSLGSFIGRAPELADLHRGLDALLDGRGALFLLSGEAGIGKTRLADELCARAREQGATIAWGGAWDGGGAPAYWPWTQILRVLRASVPVPDERLRRDLGPMWDGADASQLAVVSGGPVDPELERFRCFDALRMVLQEAAHQPLVLVLDDLHAADRASLLALHFIARALRSLPILILGTHRDAVEPEVAELVARIAREGTTLRLHPFGVHEIATVMARFDPVQPGLAEEVLRTTGGNPLIIDETLRRVRSGERLEDLRESAGAVVGERLSRLDRGLRATLEAASVLGREVAFDLLAEVAAISAGELETQLRAPSLSGIVERSTAGLRFSHSLFREGLYGSLAPERRRALHLRAGEALAARRAAGHAEPEESIARHLLEAQPDGDAARAIDWARSAGESAMRAMAYDRAAELFEGALRSAGKIAEQDVLELRLAEACMKGGAQDRARSICVAVGARAREAKDGQLLARAALLYGSQLRIALVDRTLVELLEAALSLLGDASDPALRARLLSRLAAAEQPAVDPDVPIEKARRAIALARTVGDPETMIATLYAAGSALVDFAPAEERRPLAEELIALALPRGELALAQQGYVRMAIDSFELCDLPGADLAIAGHERLGRALGHPRWWWRSAVLRAMRADLEGRWADADRHRSEALACAQQADDPNAASTLSLQSVGALRAREAGGSAELVAACSGLDAIQAEYGNLMAGVLRGVVLGRFGDRDAARRVLSSFPRVPSLLRDTMCLSLLSDAAVTVGDRSWAEELLPRLEALRGAAITWGVFGMVWEGPPEHWIGSLSLVLDRPHDAARDLSFALTRAEAFGARPLAARLREQLARAEAKIGDPGRARATLDRAGDEAAELGMHHLSKRIEVARAEISSKPAKPVVPPEPALEMPALLREAELCSIEWRGRLVRLKHSRALEILERLLDQPGRELHVLELGGAEEPIDTGDAGEVIDPEAKRAYLKRIAELEEDLHQAEAWADAGRRDRLSAELEFIREEVVRSVGLGGRTRRAAGAAERARVNVTKRLKGVIKKLEKLHPELAAHLESSVRTGLYVSYRPSHERDSRSHAEKT